MPGLIDKSRICLYTLLENGRMSAKQIITAAGRYGVGGVELMSFCEELGAPNVEVARELCRTARDSGLALPCFSVYADLSRNFSVDKDRLKGYAEICAENSIPLLHHTVDPDLGSFSMTFSERNDRFLRDCERLLDVLEYTESLGVGTVIEDQGFVFNGAESLSRLCEASRGRVGVVADIGNILFVDESPADLINTLFDRIKHVHIKDYRVTGAPIIGKRSYKTRFGRYLTDCEIGVGDADALLSVKTLEALGYKGMYSLEFAALESFDEAQRVIDGLTV